MQLGEGGQPANLAIGENLHEVFCRVVMVQGHERMARHGKTQRNNTSHVSFLVARQDTSSKRALKD